MLVNIIQIIILYRERQELEIPKEIWDLYEDIFHIKSHREFLNFWNQGKLYHVEKETLITTGDTQADLMLVLNGKADIIRNGEKLPHWKEVNLLPKSAILLGNQLQLM